MCNTCKADIAFHGTASCMSENLEETPQNIQVREASSAGAVSGHLLGNAIIIVNRNNEINIITVM